MEADLATTIASHPKCCEPRAKRTGFGWWLTLAMMVVYDGFILLVAFDRKFLAPRLGDGVTRVGIPPGSALFPYTSRALFSMIIAFVGIWLFTALDRGARAKVDRAGLLAQQVRSQSGVGASTASGH